MFAHQGTISNFRIVSRILRKNKPPPGKRILHRRPSSGIMVGEMAKSMIMRSLLLMVLSTAQVVSCSTQESPQRLKLVWAEEFNASGLPDPSADFHVYAVERHSDRLDFFVDDQKYFTYKKGARYPDYWRFDKSFYLLLNTAIGGNWGGQMGIDDSIFPLKYTIDNVRYYQWE